MQRLAELLILTIALGGSVASAQSPSAFHFRLEDNSGAPVPGARASVTVGGVGKPQALKTDGRGEFTVSGYEDKNYIATVTATAFAPVTEGGRLSSLKPMVVLTTRPLTSGGPVLMDTTPVREIVPGAWEYGVQVSGGVGLEDRTNYSFLNAGVHAGKVLTPNFGSGALRANFEYGVEVIPFWQSYTPRFQKLNCPAGATVASQCKGPTTSGGTYRGVSIVPIQLRLNFTHGERITPWIQGAGGVLYTTRKYPGIGSLNVGDPTMTGPAADTSVWNFTPQFGIGMHYFVRPRRSLDFAANAVHISSSSLGDKNPGVNTSVQFGVGWSWWR